MSKNRHLSYKGFRVLVLSVFCLFAGTSCDTFSQPPIEGRKVVSGEAYSLRVTKWAYDENAINARSKYVIETSQKDLTWKEVYKWVQDDPWPAEDIQLAIVTPKTGYFFNMVTYGVTLDSGESWTLFDFYNTSKNDVVNKSYGHEVPRVLIQNNGVGQIYYIDLQTSTPKKRVVYRTTDYGVTWHLVD